MKDFIKNNIEVLKETWKNRKIILFIFLLLSVFYIYLVLISKPENNILSPVSVFINVLVIFLLYGPDMISKTNIAKKIYELNISNIIFLTDQEKAMLNIFIFTKNSFWNLYAITSIFWLINMYPNFVSTAISLIAHFAQILTILYGLQAETFVRKLIFSVSDKMPQGE